MPPPSDFPDNRDHDLSISAVPPSALSSARLIEDFGRVPYPEGIKTPKVDLNLNAKDGKFRYDRDFLMQFRPICTEKPDMLLPLHAFGLQPSDQPSVKHRGRSGRHRKTSGTAPPAPRQDLSPSTSDNFGKRPSISGSPGRTRRRRGKKRDDANKASPGSSQQGNGAGSNAVPSGIPLGPVGVPLDPPANRWIPISISRNPQTLDSDSPEMVDRKVMGLINKLTMQNYDSISDQIITWVNRSENEKNGRTLCRVVRLVFEKAIDEAIWSEMYARLCRKMMEQISPKVQVYGIKDSEGRSIAGGQLFRKYLLIRCRNAFEGGWVAKKVTAASAATNATEDQVAKAANENSKEDGGEEEVVLYSDEHYAAQKAKRRGLGLVKFMGELFKLQMLTEGNMHKSAKKLLGNVKNPDEAKIESLCELLSTVGHILDTNKARRHMDVYLSRMTELTRSQKVSLRMQFKLQDVIELRDRKWVPRNMVAAPTTLNEAVAKEKAAQENDGYPPRQALLCTASNSSTSLMPRGNPQVPVDGASSKSSRKANGDPTHPIRTTSTAEENQSTTIKSCG